MENKDPYIRAKEEWLERYGHYIAQAKTWKMVTMVSLIITISTIYYSIISYNKPRVEAFAVEYCSKNGEYNLKKLDSMQINDDMLKSSFASWLSGIREVSSDTYINERNIKRSFSMIEKSTQAEQKALEDVLEVNKKMQEKTELVEIKIESVLRQSESSVQIDWLEILRSAKNGEIIKTAKNRGNLSYKLSKSASENELINNPTGLRIGEWRWTSVM